jgi:hypothetical protein
MTSHEQALPKFSRHAPPAARKRKYYRTRVQKIQDARWNRIYQEKFEDPDYYGLRLPSRSPQHDIC